jgi:hypothetical protein
MPGDCQLKLAKLIRSGQGAWPHAHDLRQRYVAARKMIGMLPVGTRPDDATPRLSSHA